MRDAGPSLSRVNFVDASTSVEDGRHQRRRDEVGRFAGKQALYREGSRFSLVTVDEVEAGKAGVAAVVSLIPHRGLYNERPASWRIYSAWNCFACSGDQWGAAYISLTMYFEEALIAHVLYCCGKAPEGPYEDMRRDLVYAAIRGHRKSKLAAVLPAEVRLFRDGTPIGVVSEQSLEEYPEINGRFAPAEIGGELREGLEAYRRWWSETEEESYAPAPSTDLLSGGWWLEGADGTRFDTLLPIIDFEAGTIVWRYRAAKAGV